MIKIAEKIYKSEFIRKVYGYVWYQEQGMNLTGRVLSKGPELMATVYLIEKIFNTDIEGMVVIYLVLFGMIITFLAGYYYKQLGLYDKEQTVKAIKDPISREMYEAAKKINKVR